MTLAVQPQAHSTALVHTYVPRGSARRVQEYRGPELLISGPAGTGKSRACLEKVLGVAVSSPHVRVLVLRKTLASLTSTTLVTWREHVAVEALESGFCQYYGGSASEPPQYRFGNGSKVIIGGMDKPSKIMSSEYDLVYFAEATEATITDWDSITTRLRNYKITFQQLIADCNPDYPKHWLKQRADGGTCHILYAQHWENPKLYDEVPEGTPDAELHEGKWYRKTVIGRDYLAKLNNLTGVRRLRLLDGVWAAAEGLVYSNWNPAVHIWPKRIHLPHRWRRYWVVDFGFTNPFVCQWWAEDDDGRLWRYREIYMTGRLVEDHARQILRKVCRIQRMEDLTAAQHELVANEPLKAIEQGLMKWYEPKPAAIICDHDAEDRATLTRHLGMGTRPALKSVTRGIQALEKRLEVAGDGKPRLILLPDSLVEVDEELKTAGKPTCMEDEFGTYVWPDGKPGRNEDEHPVKEHDHAMDTGRYLVAYKDFRRRWTDRENGLEG